VTRPVPEGFVRLAHDGAEVVAHQKLAEAVRLALASRTLYDWARDHPQRRTLQGRLPVYAAPLPLDGPRVVVRHAHHGGRLAPLLRDLFLPPTRAAAELTTSLILAHAGVPTPPVVAYAVYRAGPLLRRADVMSVELPGQDLGAALNAATDDAAREPLVAPVAALLGALTQAGAWHPDLNVKNILLRRRETAAPEAMVIDIDVIDWDPRRPAEETMTRNIDRLLRSMLKWKRQFGCEFTEQRLSALQRAAHDTIAGR
jgi:tRNA A-37 threonylcarbamoyl transferase component Bud32